MSAAARLAKLRHDVTLVESGPRLGGRLHGVEIDGESWPLDVETVTLPGAFRDLFRKSGRPMDRALEMTLTEGRRHLFHDGVALDLPFGDRALQHDAVRAALEPEHGGPDPADEWSDWVDAWPERWDVQRRALLDRVTQGREDLDRSARRTLRVRRSVQGLVRRDLDDARLRRLVLDPLRLDGQDRRATPEFLAVQHYLERTFGRWRFAGGYAGLAAALQTRIAERKVEVVLDETAHELSMTGPGGSVAAVVTDRRSLPAQVVVWCAPTLPLGLPPPRGLPAIPASRTFVTLDDGVAPLPCDVLAHADPPVRVAAHGDGRMTLVHHHGGEDVLVALARVGLDVREHVIDRTTLSPADLVRGGHWGWAWQGWSSIDDHPGVAPRHGVHVAGAHAWSGGTLERIAMATAAIADAVGPAPR